MIKKIGRGKHLDRGKMILFSIKMDPVETFVKMENQKSEYEKAMKLWEEGTKKQIVI